MSVWIGRIVTLNRLAAKVWAVPMGDHEHTADIHDLDVTVWVGKGGVEAVVDELDAQLEQREMVKVRMLRAGRAGETVADLADRLARAVDGTVVDVRGHTAVIRR